MKKMIYFLPLKSLSAVTLYKWGLLLDMTSDLFPAESIFIVSPEVNNKTVRKKTVRPLW
jgi:hypothetical protein